MPCATSITSSQSAVVPLRDADDLAHAIGEDLGAAARESSRGPRAIRRRTASPVERFETLLMCFTSAGDRPWIQSCGYLRLHPAEELLVELDAEVGVQAALQQDLLAAERERLLDLLR